MAYEHCFNFLSLFPVGSICLGLVLFHSPLKLLLELFYGPCYWGKKKNHIVARLGSSLYVKSDTRLIWLSS